MSDTEFIREVDEELRREQMKSLWDRFGIYVIGVAVLIVLLTAGYRGWQYWQKTSAQDAGTRYMAAIQQARDGQHDDAATQLNQLATSTPGGYPLLARFRAASEKAAAGDKAAAVAAFDALAADTSIGELYQGLAKIRAGYLAVDIEDRAKLEQRLGTLAATESPWRGAAREILGLAAWKADDYKEADTYFTQILQDASSTRDAQQRALTMLALTRSHLKPAETDTSAKTDKAGEKGE